MRILLIAASYPTRAAPLPGIFTKPLVEALHERGHWVTVVSPVFFLKRVDPTERIERLQTMMVFRPPWLRLPRRIAFVLSSFLAFFSILPVYFRTGRPDVIHAESLLADGIPALLFRWFFGVPYVVRHHSSDHSFWFGKLSWRIASALVIRNASAVVCVSRGQQRALEERFSGTFHIIPNGVCREFIDAQTVRKVPASPRALLHVGNWVRVKGVDLLLEAFRILSTRGHYRLTLCGEGEEEVLLKRTVSETIPPEMVAFQRSVPVQELIKIYGSHDLLILPSRSESFGIVIVEGLLCGLPVVATRCDGPIDLVTDRFGVLVPPNDPAALAEGIEKAFERYSHWDVEGAAADARARYSYPTVVKEFERLYGESRKKQRGSDGTTGGDSQRDREAGERTRGRASISAMCPLYHGYVRSRDSI